MKSKCLTYTVELTREEIDTVTTALNSEYKFLKEKYANARQQNAAEVYERMDEARTLRNDFARLKKNLLKFRQKNNLTILLLLPANVCMKCSCMPMNT